MAVRSISDLDVAGRRVLVRADLNVPLGEDANGVRVITDDGRIRASVPTIRALTERGAKVIVCAHLGRPKGEVRPEFSLAPAAARLSELLAQPVVLASDVVGESARATVAALQDGQVAMLENLRFEAAETSKVDAERAAFAAKLAELADLFVSDGFGVVHRKQASVYDIALLLPHAAGGLVQTEAEIFGKVLHNPDRPYVVVLGGSKVSDKLGVISALLGKVDRLLIGGGMCFTFLAAMGHSIGSSLFEADHVEHCKRLLDEHGDRLHLPSDIVGMGPLHLEGNHRPLAARGADRARCRG